MGRWKIMKTTSHWGNVKLNVERMREVNTNLGNSKEAL